VRGLIADIGATNARFALVEPGGAIVRTRDLACEDYPSLEDAIADYLGTEGIPRPRAAAIAVASPIAGDHIAFTNNPWAFSIAEMKRRLALERLEVVNDFMANALAVPHLSSRDHRQVGGGSRASGAPIGILGPGSGLGVSGLFPLGDGKWAPIASEGGHVTMPAASEREAAVLGLMRRRFDHVSAERALSGPGLVNLYAALTELDGVPAAAYRPAQITDAAIGEHDPYCREATEMFCAMLGTIAGNLALTLGARGGIFIAGGIVPKLGPAFDASPFRRRFEEKGRFRDYVAAIATSVITHPVPAFLGLAGLLD